MTSDLWSASAMAAISALAVTGELVRVSARVPSACPLLSINTEMSVSCTTLHCWRPMTSSSTAGGSALQNATDVELQSHEELRPWRGDTCPLFHAIPMLFGAQSRRAMTSALAQQVYATLPPHQSPRAQTLPKALAMPIPSEKRLARLASFATAWGP
jgi:hypothetical protein